MSRMERRIEKVMYGSLWATKRTYIKDGIVVGWILSNPHTDKYEVVKNNFDRTTSKREFNKFTNARDWLLGEW